MQYFLQKKVRGFLQMMTKNEKIEALTAALVLAIDCLPAAIGAKQEKLDELFNYFFTKGVQAVVPAERIDNGCSVGLAEKYLKRSKKNEKNNKKCEKNRKKSAKIGKKSFGSQKVNTQACG